MLNVALWLGYRRDSTDLRQRLADVRSRAETVSAEVVDLSKGLDRLEALNEQVEFLNERIAERTFPWSLLFERLGEILPLGVRLKSLNPSVRAGPGGGDPSFDTVLLKHPEKTLGVANSCDSMYLLPGKIFDLSGFQLIHTMNSCRT